jgi:hypothetical protein
MAKEFFSSALARPRHRLAAAGGTVTYLIYTNFDPGLSQCGTIATVSVIFLRPIDSFRYWLTLLTNKTKPLRET